MAAPMPHTHQQYSDRHQPSTDQSVTVLPYSDQTPQLTANQVHEPEPVPVCMCSATEVLIPNVMGTSCHLLLSPGRVAAYKLFFQSPHLKWCNINFIKDIECALEFYFIFIFGWDIYLCFWLNACGFFSVIMRVCFHYFRGTCPSAFVTQLQLPWGSFPLTLSKHTNTSMRWVFFNSTFFRWWNLCTLGGVDLPFSSNF